nr:hypothetical protein [uncultured Holophaga sp.]
MRLGALFLIPLGLVAQVPNVQRTLPWEQLPEPPWQLADAAGGGEAAAPLVTTAKADGPLRVLLREDGSLRVVDAKGLVTLRLGLPGRPVKVWRDAGTVVPLPAPELRFPAHSEIDGGLASLPLAPGEDVRGRFTGLLWILDDGEKTLTIVNPARGQVVFLPLPAGGNPDLAFHPSHLQVWTGGGATLTRQERMVWRLPWVGLLPQFLTLSSPRAAGKPGTALKPFPAE